MQHVRFLLITLTSALILSGCNKAPAKNAPKRLEGPRAVHIRFEFRQSPLEGVPKRSDIYDKTDPQVLDIAVALSPSVGGPATLDEVNAKHHVEGLFQLYHTLRDNAKVLLIGRCEYDLDTGNVTVYPRIARLRPPDNVFPRLAYMGGSPRPPFTTHLPFLYPMVLSTTEPASTKEDILLTAPRNIAGYIFPLETKDGEPPIFWGVTAQVVSHGALPTSSPMQKTRDGHYIYPANYGFSSLMLE